VHIVVDAKSKEVVSFRVTKGNVDDPKKFSPMIRKVFEQYEIDKVYADKVHDNERSSKYNSFD
jgi:hypothetical protein